MKAANTIQGEPFARFSGITEKSIEILNSNGITGLFPIQVATFDAIYSAKDVIARDLTGTGKTLAFCLPLVERLRRDQKFGGARKPRAIILAPTRELAVQVGNELSKLKHSKNEFRVALVYGGVAIDKQEQMLREGVEFIVGTTGRTIDHISRGNADLTQIETVVLDEADRMLDMGFQEDIENIMGSVIDQCDADPQFVLFSATIPPWVREVAKKHLHEGYELIDLVKNLKNKTAKSVEHLAIP